MRQEKSRMKKKLTALSLVVIAVISALALCSCDAKSDTLTMYVGLGQGGDGYYEKVREAVEKGTGVKLEFVYNNTMDTTNSMVNMIQNNDLPADIIATSSKTKNEYCRASLLDMAAYTNITDSFKATDIEAITDEDGAVYQLPFATRLIGIGYNKTLMKEMGWELPRNYKEMLELKAKADAAGVRFAVFCTAATGHGFNNLFHLMGADYLITPDGTEWFNDFIDGDTGIAGLSKSSIYFKNYAEAGLYGDVYSKDWSVAQEFAQTRTLFYYNIITEMQSYEGPQYDLNGNIIEGKTLHDEFGIMPWLSEDGSTNCFTEYNCLYLGLNKKLLDDEDKLADANKVLNYMLSDEVMSIFSEYCKDGIVKTHSYEIGKDRLYYDYADAVNKGYTMPWYYNSFDPDTIVNVGEKVNQYLSGDGSVSVSGIMRELEYRNKERLKGNTEALTKIEETLDYAEVAELEAKANLLAADKALSESGESGEVELALLPYIEAAGDINEIVKMPIVQTKMYKGNLDESKLNSYVNSHANDIAIVKLSGKEISKLAEKGFDASIDFGYEHVFKIACVSKDDAELESDKDYLVAIPWEVLGTEKFEQYKKDGKVIMKDGEPLKTTTIEGLHLL